MSSQTFRIGDIVSWNSEAGYVTGKITKIHTSPFLVNGYHHHASGQEPQYEIVSQKTGHIAFHKGSTLQLQM